MKQSPPNRLTNSSGVATVKSLLWPLDTDRWCPCCARWYPDIDLNTNNNTACWDFYAVYSVSKKKSPHCGLRFSDIFSQTVDNFKSFFTHWIHVLIYARLQIFIQLSQILTKLCHIKRDYLVHIICSKCPRIGRNAHVQTFAKVVDSFVDRCLWQVFPDLLLL